MLAMSKKVKRLAEQFLPATYNLVIDTDIENLKFSGTAEITGQKVGRPNKRLTFHQKDLKIVSAKVIKTDKAGTRELKITRINTHKSYDEVRLHFDELIYPGQYKIILDFAGQITENFTGLYPSYFNDTDGAKKVILATQFESHHARELFPCIDEPVAKAVFDLTIKAPTGLTVLANTEVSQQKTTGNQQIVTFKPSPTMSTYLLAFAIGDIHCVEAKSAKGILVRSWASTAQGTSKLQYANDEAVKVLDFFEDYFGTPFPLKKLDQLALPDFESGAMENWGLITYREIAMLDDPDNPSVPTRQYVSMVIAHEISHQWFGNLVTMKWWDDLWLNESFASLMEHVALASLHPDWHQWEEYASQDIIACSNRDIYSDVQSVGTDVKHPDEIGSLFDPAIVYAKGGRLLKMLKDYIGEDNFRQGLKLYFKKHKYQNTYRDDLWNALSEASGQDIHDLMTPWLTQSGMPVVKITKDKDVISLHQERFVLDKDNDQTLWPIPLLADTPDSPKLLTKENFSYKSDELPLLNQNGSAHFVTHYSAEADLDTIIKRIKSDPDKSEARINTLNDLMLLARRGDNSLTQSLKLVHELSGEPRDAVWALMSRSLGLAYNLGEDNQIIEDGLKKLRYQLAHKNYQTLGWDDQPDDDPNTKQLRATQISLMIGAEDADIVGYARDIFDATKDVGDIASDRRGLVFGAVVRNYDEPKIIDKLVDAYKTTNDPDLQLSITSGLSSTKLAEVANHYIAEGLSDGGFVRPQDIPRWYAYMMRNKYTRTTAWQWLNQDWTRIEKLFGKSLDSFVIYSSGFINTQGWAKEFNNFFDKLANNPAISRNVQIAKAEINARIAWRNRETDKLQDFFKSLQ